MKNPFARRDTAAVTISSWTHEIVTAAADGDTEIGRVMTRDQLRYGYWYVHDLYVAPQWRQRGVARRLMAAVLAAHPFDRLELVPSPFADGMTREQLAAWYSRLGFVVSPSANTDRPPRESDPWRMARPSPR